MTQLCHIIHSHHLPSQPAISQSTKLMLSCCWRQTEREEVTMATEEEEEEEVIISANQNEKNT